VTAEVFVSLQSTYIYSPSKDDMFTRAALNTEPKTFKQKHFENKILYAQPLLFGLLDSAGFVFGFFNVIPRNYPKYCIYQTSHFRFCAHKIHSAKHLAENKSPVNLRAQKYNQPPF